MCIRDRGISIERERKKLLLCAVILAGASTAFAGNIGFVGLLAPHASQDHEDRTVTSDNRVENQLTATKVSYTHPLWGL